MVLVTEARTRPATPEEVAAAKEGVRGKARTGVKQESAYAGLFQAFMSAIDSGARGLTLIFGPDEGHPRAYLTAQGLRRLAREEGSPVSIHQTEDPDGIPMLVVIPKQEN